MHLVGQLRARPQPRVRADAGLRADLRLLEQAERGDLGAGAHGRVAQHAVRPHAHPVAERDPALEHAAHVDEHVAPHRQRAAHIDARRVGQGCALLQQRLRDAPLRHPLGGRPLRRAVDAGHLRRIRRGHRRHRAVLAHRRGHHVGQVVLVLGVVVGQRAEPALQRRGRRHQDAGVDLGDRQLVAMGVLLLDDLEHLAVPVAHDAAVAGRVGQGDGQQAQPAGAAVARRRQQPLQRGGGDQRHVAIEHQCGRGLVQQGGRLLHRMARPELRRLHHELQAGTVGEGGAHRVGAVSHHHDHPRRRPGRPSEFDGGVDDVG